MADLNDTVQLKLQPNRMASAGILSRFLFWWMNPLFKLGRKKKITECDMYQLQHEHESSLLLNILEKNWISEINKKKRNNDKKPSLFKAVIKTHISNYCLLVLYGCVLELSYVIMPLVIGGLISYFEDIENTPISHAYLNIAAVGVIAIFSKTIEHYILYLTTCTGWHIRIASCGLMYKKMLRLSQKSLSQSSTGQVVNLGSNDVMRFDRALTLLPFLISAPLEALCIAIILYIFVGRAAMVGIAVSVALVIYHVFNGQVYARVRAKVAVITDKRVGLMSEIIAGIRIIKMYTWEKSFSKIIMTVRKKEIKSLMILGIVQSISGMMSRCSGKIGAFVTFVVAVHLGDELTVSKVFMTLAFFNDIAVVLGLLLQGSITYTAETMISLRRIQNFLLLDEIEQKSKIEDGGGRPIAKLENFSGKWETEADDSFSLKNISFTAENNSLIIIIGHVGSGKSSILNSILKELPGSIGKLVVNGKISYTNQTAWILPGTLRENILLGKAFDKKRYDAVVEACALLQDLELMPAGDLTQIGDRGVNLSGGQKARISLARAAYDDDIDICLLDDPFAAVDVAVANFIFKQCICRLLKNKIRILVTHQLQLLKQADLILVIQEGKVTAQGSYQKLVEDGTNFVSLLKSDKNCVSSMCSEDSEFNSMRKKTLLSNATSISSQSLDSMSSDEEFIKVPDSPESKLLKQVQQKQIGTEQNEEGSVSSSVYADYFRISDRAPHLLVYCFLLISAQVLAMIADWWIAKWATKYVEYQASLHSNDSNITSNNDSFVTSTSNVNDSVIVEFDRTFYINLTAVLITSTMVLIFLHNFLMYYLNLTSGIHMHNRMFETVMKAPIRFFDTNSVGNVLNRFTKDMGQIDEQLPPLNMDLIGIFIVCVGSTVLSIVVNIFIVIVILPLVVYLMRLQKYYLCTARNIKRLEGSTRSPVFSLLSSTLQGLSTIRAFQAEKHFMREFHSRQDLHSAAWFLFLTGQRWFALRLDILSSVFFFSVTLLCVLTSSITTINASIIGLMVVYAWELFGRFQYGMRRSTELESLMTSVERVQQYYRIAPEPDLANKEALLPSEWPQHGVITYDNVSFSYYKGGPAALKNIRFNIRAQEKVGIVGRTGAGKSSIIASLFRFSDSITGQILVDGVPTKSLRLELLRSAISIIPQDPMLFTGTVRHNLDPFLQYEDKDIWDALEQVQLKDLFNSLPMKLETKVSESGQNFSVGQCQLVCLARAILRQRRILVIDEATANVDLRTDRIIQKIILEKFKLCTVITIAHRLDTIIDSDRVMVLNEGKIMEFEEPHNLLQNPKSYFTALVESSGASNKLRKKAKKAFDVKNIPDLLTQDKFGNPERSLLQSSLPSPGTYDYFDLETGV